MDSLKTPSIIDLQHVDAVIFDLGGVILNLDYNLTIAAFKKLGGKQFDALYSQAQQDKIFDAYEIGKITSDEFITYLKQFLPNTTTDQEIIDAWNLMLLNLPPNRISFIESLKTKCRVFLFSNTNDLHYNCFKSMLESEFGNSELLEELFEEACFSHMVKKRKPNEASFKYILEKYNLSPERTVFIDDSAQHIEGAQKCGLQTYHLVNEDIINIFEGHNL